MIALFRTALFSAVIGMLTVGAIIYTPACNQLPVITADVVNEVQCVAAQVEAGQTTFEDIAVACAPALVSDVVTIVTTLLTADAGDVAAKARAVHHKVAK